MAMMAMTTSSSMSVNPDRRRRRDIEPGLDVVERSSRHEAGEER
jgi:hypothetical protein